MVANGYQPPLFEYQEEEAAVLSVRAQLHRCKRVWRQVRASLTVPLCSVGRTPAGPSPPPTIQDIGSGFLRETSHSGEAGAVVRGAFWNWADHQPGRCAPATPSIAASPPHVPRLPDQASDGVGPVSTRRRSSSGTYHQQCSGLRRPENPARPSGTELDSPPPDPRPWPLLRYFYRAHPDKPGRAPGGARWEEGGVRNWLGFSKKVHKCKLGMWNTLRSQKWKRKQINQIHLNAVYLLTEG